MRKHKMQRRLSASAAIVGLATALPFAVAATPAYAAAPVTVTKTHQGNFNRGGVGTYTITVRNNSLTESSGEYSLVEHPPAGLTLINDVSTPEHVCHGGPGGIFGCTGTGSGLAPGESFTLTLTFSVAGDAPCSVVNNVTFSAENSPSVSVDDPTTITGGGCGGGDNGGGGSILPINLSGLFPFYNNISINNNIKSPGATNNTTQNFHVNGS
ncbi:hypothetical protein [Streptomyces sp. NPDC055006]|uniref:DUF11 domain-containing protein n=2 Tax=Streptomyces aureus TaxID=193461 RepID=A0ABV4SW68_9ACTN